MYIKLEVIVRFCLTFHLKLCFRFIENENQHLKSIHYLYIVFLNVVFSWSVAGVIVVLSGSTYDNIWYQIRAYKIEKDHTSVSKQCLLNIRHSLSLTGAIHLVLHNKKN